MFLSIAGLKRCIQDPVQRLCEPLLSRPECPGLPDNASPAWSRSPAKSARRPRYTSVQECVWASGESSRVFINSFSASSGFFSSAAVRPGHNRRASREGICRLSVPTPSGRRCEHLRGCAGCTADPPPCSSCFCAAVESNRAPRHDTLPAAGADAECTPSSLRPSFFRSMAAMGIKGRYIRMDAGCFS